ncbi:uncharacterized protein LOC112043604 isoform X2 [Bicyclus anynana]|uniref:Uncharacterized protein LOC112043604 isoform X2 n=1 Tax=Bicyclus anynana TaxID=110368 RepID=A0ABM3LL73_BICAN|nr:uncharacterized protein LOC112043604 isoform X2 [Bicyclus anynana]
MTLVPCSMTSAFDGHSRQKRANNKKCTFMLKIFIKWSYFSVNLKIGFDLTRGKNGAPSLRIRDFEEVPEFRDHKKKRALKSESSSESDENDDGKIIPHIKKAKESDSSDLDTSGSDDDDRRLSTKGILPNEFEPERQPRVHGVNDKGSDTE